MNVKKKLYTKIALALSICALLVWGLMGAGTSLAWFKDTTPVQKNVFQVGVLDVALSYKKDGGYQPVDYQTKVFDENALYEPGYVQVVYLKVENKGNVPFDYKLAVNATNASTVKGVLGNDIYLPDYLEYHVLFGAEEAALTREVANTLAVTEFPEQPAAYPLNVYAQEDPVTVPAQGERYVAIIVRMPQSVGNAANHRGTTAPNVELGITVFASQEGTL